MALGLIMPTEGTVELFGRDPIRQGARALEGVAGFVEAPTFYPYLSARKNLELLARPRRRRRAGADPRGARDRRAEPARRAPRGRLLPRHAPAPRHRRRAAAPPAPVDPRRARHRPRPRGDARHARADPPAGRPGDHRPALQPPAAGGAGTVRPCGDRRPLAASSTRARSPTCAARAGPATGCAPPTTPARSRCCAPSPASSTPADRASTASPSRRRSRDVGTLSIALGAAGVGDPRADPGTGDARGPLLPAHRGRRSSRGRRDPGATARRHGSPTATEPRRAVGPESPDPRKRRAAHGARSMSTLEAPRRWLPPARPRQAPLHAHRLPLGAAQARLAEAHLPRAGAGGRSCRSSS